MIQFEAWNLTTIAHFGGLHVWRNLNTWPRFERSQSDLKGVLIDNMTHEYCVLIGHIKSKANLRLGYQLCFSLIYSIFDRDICKIGFRRWYCLCWKVPSSLKCSFCIICWHSNHNVLCDLIFMFLFIAISDSKNHTLKNVDFLTRYSAFSMAIPFVYWRLWYISYSLFYFSITSNCYKTVGIMRQNFNSN